MENGKREEVRVSPKLDGVYARATKDGVFSKSGKPLDVPHIQKRLKPHFWLRPKSELKGELWREGLGVEQIAGAARKGGAAAGPLRLHTFPDQGPRPFPIGAVRRIGAKTARNAGEVEKLYKAALVQGHEGAMIRHGDGRIEKRKPRQDAEYEVARPSAGKRGVLVTKDGFKVQGRAGLAAKAGDRVTVSYSGLTRKGVPKAAVAERVRNDKDFGTLNMEHRTLNFEVKTGLTQAGEDEVRKDRRALLKGALVAAGGVGALALLARKSRGGIVGQEPWVPKPKVAAAATGAKAAAANSLAKHGDLGAAERAVKAGQLRRKRAWAAVEKPFGKRAGKLKPDEANRAIALYGQGRKGAAVSLPGKTPVDQLSPWEKTRVVNKYERGQRQKARQELLVMREKKQFGASNMEHRTLNFEMKKKRDGWDKARDGAVAAGALATGGAAVYGARQWGKTNRVLRDTAEQAGRTVKQVGENLQPKEIARAGLQEVKRAAKGQVKAYFPTFSKWARRLKQPVKFATPAAGVIDFAGAQQVRDVDDDTFASALRGYSGMQRVYYTPGGKERGGDEVGVGHGQLIRDAMNKGKKIHQTAIRGGALGKDALDVLRGKERERDSAGRKKKREWEKSWFRNKVGQVAAGAAMLGGATVLRNSPTARRWVQDKERKVIRRVRQGVGPVQFPDAFAKNRIFERRASSLELGTLKQFATPAAGLFAKAEKAVRGSRLGKFLGPEKAKLAGLAQREATLAKLRGMEGAKAKRVAGRLARDVKFKKGQIKVARDAQGRALGNLKKGAAVAGVGTLAGGTAMKLYADQPEKDKLRQGARLRNGLMGSAAGAFLGGALAGGKSGYKGARVGAALGGLMGVASNPKRKTMIEDLPTAGFEVKAERLKTEMLREEEMKGFVTPAGRVIGFDWAAEDAGWDVRDPRGKSARVFAPGSRRRERREKRWHERKDNRDKLALAGMALAGVAGLAGGAAIGRKFPQRPKVPVKAADAVVSDVVPFRKAR